MPELVADLRRDPVLLRADLDLLEAEGMVWHRDLVMELDGVELTEICWWAPRVAMPAQQEGEG